MPHISTVPTMIAAMWMAGPAAAQPLTAASLCGPNAPSLASPGPARATLAGGPVTFANRWASGGATTFSHVIDGAPGPIRLTLETCSSATGGETVALYPATAAGLRMPRRARVMFSVAVPRGNVRHATMTIPRNPKGGNGSVHLAVVVENASGRHHEGTYRLTVTR